jgi:hypothetical protein
MRILIVVIFGSDTTTTTSAPITTSAPENVISNSNRQANIVPTATRNINQRLCCPSDYSRFGDICRQNCEKRL